MRLWWSAVVINFESSEFSVRHHSAPPLAYLVNAVPGINWAARQHLALPFCHRIRRAYAFGFMPSRSGRPPHSTLWNPTDYAEGVFRTDAVPVTSLSKLVDHAVFSRNVPPTIFVFSCLFCWQTFIDAYGFEDDKLYIWGGVAFCLVVYVLCAT